MDKSNSSRVFAFAAAGCMGLGLGGFLAPMGANAQADNTEVAQTKGGFFSSFTQAFKFDPEHDVVRGHFDVGSAPDMHRFYCVVNEKSGEKRLNAVSGETLVRKDGKTRLKAGAAVSVNSCESAESTGVLDTSGYVLTGIPDKPYKASKAAANTRAPGVATPSEDAPAAATSTPAAAGGAATPWTQPAAAPPAAATSAPKSERVDVAGVRLGMSPDEVRNVLRGRKFPNYFESANVVGSARSINTIAAWNSPRAAKDAADDGEAYEIMFAPLPGHERAVAVVHTVGYSAARAVPETALQEGVVNKYKGFAAAKDVPGAATWRYQRDGSVQVGDGCDKRGLFGGLGELSVAYPPRENIVLKTSREELRAQLEHCGASIITEDHVLLGGGAGADRLVYRFTVSAYSPAIAVDALGGLKAAESGNSAAGVLRIGERPARDL